MKEVDIDWSPKGQRLWKDKHEWSCGRPVRLNSRMKRASNKQCIDTLNALLKDLGV